MDGLLASPPPVYHSLKESWEMEISTNPHSCIELCQVLFCATSIDPFSDPTVYSGQIVSTWRLSGHTAGTTRSHLIVVIVCVVATSS
jgi:hypothetical protein